MAHPHLSFDPEQTQKLVVGTSVLLKLVGFAFCAWAGVVAWIGIELIHRVDAMSSQFTSYVNATEHRITALEETQKAQDTEARALRRELEFKAAKK